MSRFLVLLALLAMPQVHQVKHKHPRVEHKLSNKLVKGVAFHICSCTAPCQCMFDGDDMKGCLLTAVYHFTDGGYIGKDLAGLTAIVVSRPEKLEATDKTARVDNSVALCALYEPKGITVKAKQHLNFALFEHLMRLGWQTPVIREADIRFKKVAGGYDIEIPGILHATTAAILGADKKQMIVENVGFQEGGTWWLGKTSGYKYQDPAEATWKWDLSKTNGAWCEFGWHEIYHP